MQGRRKRGEELPQSWPFSAISKEENRSSESDRAPALHKHGSQVQKLSPSITRCLLHPRDLHPDMQDKEQQLPMALEGEETGLREPQVPDAKWEGKTEIGGL